MLSGLTSIASSWVYGVLIGGLVLFLGLLSIKRFRVLVVRLRWWLLGLLALVVTILMLGVLPGRLSGLRLYRLPGFLSARYSTWLWLFAMLAGGAGVALWRQWRMLTARSRQALASVAGDPAADVEAAWGEAALRLERGGIAPASQRVLLVLSPGPEWPEAVLGAAGEQVIVRCLEPHAPIQVWATTTGLVVSCHQASGFGMQSPEGARRLERLCALFRDLEPDCSIVRGVVVLFPVPWAARGEAVPEAGAVRDDLQAIRRVLRVNCPIYAVVPGMETVPGFTEFLARMARQVGPQMLERRVGFGIPDTRVFSGELISNGLVWLSGWYGTWTGSLMAGDPLNHEGNAELATLDSEIRRYRKRFRAICEAAFLTPSESEPLLFRGLYLVGSGREAGSQGFAAGLLRGARSLIPSDHSSTRWTAEAQADDRRHILTALAVAAVGLLLSLIIWLPLARKSSVAGAGLVLLAAAWVVMGFRAGRSVWRATRAAAQPTT